MSILNTAETLLSHAKSCGAEAAEIIYFEATDISTACRLGKLEEMERSESAGIGLRVFVGQSSASASASNLQLDSLKALTEKTVAIAGLAPADEFAGLADSHALAQPNDIADLQLYDGEEPTPQWLLEQCETAEDAARSQAGISNSDGASASYSQSETVLVTSHGFEGRYRTSRFGVSASVIAGSGDTMETDYAYHSTRFRNHLRSAESIGLEAAERTLKRLNPKKPNTCKLPVIFDPRIGKQMLGYLAGAISGSSVARGTSFLKDKRGEQLFASNISVIDNPRREKGLGSRPFDGEGCRSEPLEIIKDGILQHWLLDSRSARQLGLASNGRAARGLASPPSPSSTNLYLQAGNLSPAELMADIKEGLYITDTFGMGVNLVTGDYSQGASGFWIENGEITHPVSEFTIASTLPEMFQRLTPANDLEFLYSTNTPTLRIEQMTLAGN